MFDAPSILRDDRDIPPDAVARFSLEIGLDRLTHQKRAVGLDRQIRVERLYLPGQERRSGKENPAGQKKATPASSPASGCPDAGKAEHGASCLPTKRRP